MTDSSLAPPPVSFISQVMPMIATVTQDYRVHCLQILGLQWYLLHEFYGFHSSIAEDPWKMRLLGCHKKLGSNYSFETASYSRIS